jgi:hypothetical protein
MDENPYKSPEARNERPIRSYWTRLRRRTRRRKDSGWQMPTLSFPSAWEWLVIILLLALLVFLLWPAVQDSRGAVGWRLSGACGKLFQSASLPPDDIILPAAGKPAPIGCLGFRQKTKRHHYRPPSALFHSAPAAGENTRAWPRPG